MNTWKPDPHTARKLGQLSVVYCGAEGGSRAEHSHPDVQVGIHLVRRSSLISDPLHIHVYPSWQPHSASWSPGHEMVVFHLPGNLLIDVRQELSRGIDFELIPTRGARDRVLEGLALMVRNEFENSDTFSDLYIESVAQMLARHLLRKYAAIAMPEPRSHSLTERELARLHRFVRDRLPSGFSVRELAQAIGTGPSVLARKLSLSTGLSPWRFVEQQRILRAKALLRNGNQPIAAIAAQLGYTDQSHFTNAFRRATGLTPKTYRGNRSR